MNWFQFNKNVKLEKLFKGLEGDNPTKKFKDLLF